MTNKLFKTALCTILALSFTTTNIFATDFNWTKMLNSEKPFTQKQNEIAEKLSVDLNAESTSDGITIRARKLFGDRYEAIIAIDIISNNGKKLPKANTLTFFNTSSIDMEIGEYRPHGASVVSKDCDLDLSDPASRVPFFEKYVQGSVNLFRERGSDVSDYEKTMYFYCWGATGPGANFDGYGFGSSPIGNKAVFDLSKLYSLHPDVDLSKNTGFELISSGKWHFEVPLDYADISKEIIINKSYTKFIGGKDRTVTIKRALVTPLQIVIDGTIEQEEGERLPYVIKTTVKLANGQIVTKDKYRVDNFYAVFTEPVDLGKDGKNIESIIIDGHEFKVK